MNDEGNDNPVPVISVLDGVGKRGGQYFPEIAVNGPMNLALLLDMGKTGAEDRQKTASEARVTLCIIPVCSLCYVVENLWEQPKRLHERSVFNFVMNCSRVRAESGFLRNAAQR